jgi:hypothetical protein
MISKTVRESSRDVNVTNQVSAPEQRIPSSYLTKHETLSLPSSRATKKDVREQLRSFASEVNFMVDSLTEVEKAKEQLFNMEGFSPNLVLSLITRNHQEGCFNFEEFKSFVCDYLGLKA